MVVLGLILLVLALAVVAYMWFATGDSSAVGIDYGILNVDLHPFWLFVAGGITLAAATCGLWMMAVGTRSKARKAKEVRELRRQAKEADRRAVRADDASSLDRPAGSTGRPGYGTAPGRATGTTEGRPVDGTHGRPTGTTDRSDAPILPRPDGRGSTRSSSLDVDR